MEAHGARDFPLDSLRGRFIRRALQAAVIDVILPAFAEQILAAGASPGLPWRFPSDFAVGREEPGVALSFWFASRSSTYGRSQDGVRWRPLPGRWDGAAPRPR
jgi:hypothetical protein